MIFIDKEIGTLEYLSETIEEKNSIEYIVDPFLCFLEMRFGNKAIPLIIFRVFGVSENRSSVSRASWNIERW